MNEYKYPEDKDQIRAFLKDLPEDKSLKIIIKKWTDSKSNKQTRGLYRIMNLIAQHLRSIEPSYLWSSEDVKEIIKRQIGFMKYSQKAGFKVFRSIKDANMEEMNMLIEEAQRWGYEMDCPLKSLDLLPRELAELEECHTLTWDELAKFYDRKTGNCARIRPMNAVYQWAVKQEEIKVTDDGSLILDEKTYEKI